jgi:hypothetical protein
LVVARSSVRAPNQAAQSPPSAVFEGACDSSRSAKQSATFTFSAEKSEILLVFAILSALREPENLSWKLTHDYRIVRTLKAHFDLASSAFEGKGNRRRGTAKEGYIRIEKQYSGDSRFQEGC